MSREDVIHEALATGIGGCHHPKFRGVPAECQRVDKALEGWQAIPGANEESDEEVLARLLRSVNLAQIVHEALGYGTDRHGPPTCGNVAELIEALLLARVRTVR